MGKRLRAKSNTKLWFQVCLRSHTKKLHLKLGKANVKFSALTRLNPENFLIGNLFCSHHIRLVVRNMRNNVTTLCVFPISQRMSEIKSQIFHVVHQFALFPWEIVFFFHPEFIQMKRFVNSNIDTY